MQARAQSFFFHFKLSVFCIYSFTLDALYMNFVLGYLYPQKAALLINAGERRKISSP